MACIEEEVELSLISVRLRLELYRSLERNINKSLMERERLGEVNSTPINFTVQKVLSIFL